MIDVSNNDEILQAIELMYFGYREFTAGPDSLLEKRGLNRSHHRILYFVARQENLSVGELLDILGISKQALNTPLRQLTAMNLVKSRRSDDDARVKQLTLSANGRRLEKALTRSQRGLLNEVFASAGPTATAGWLRVMRKLVESDD